MGKIVAAVLFGGGGVEHDVSVLTGTELIKAMDHEKFEPLPIYIDPDGSWWHGAALLDRKNYYPSYSVKRTLNKLSLPIGQDMKDRPYFNIDNASFFSANKKLFFDIAFFAFHGSVGESGNMQGAFDVLQIPYTGARMLESSIFMNKHLSKSIVKNHDIPVLDSVLITKPSTTLTIDTLKNYKIQFPACIKPTNLGSSVGVHKAENLDDAYTALLEIFKVDTEAIIEPFVPNLVEYNIAVTKCFNGNIALSAIESPIKDGDWLSFRDKYLAQGGLESKLAAPTHGAASATRTFNPKLSKKQESIIRESAKKIATILPNFAGSPRIDFLCDSKSKEIWFNEINPIPGSLAYYLWENSADHKTSYTQFITYMIEEGFKKSINRSSEINLRSIKASIFIQ